MNEQLEKELKKQKKVLILCALGLVFSVLFIVVFYLQNDKRFIGFIAILAVDIFELSKQMKLYKKTKQELGK